MARNAFERSARAAGFSAELLRALARRQVEVERERKKRSRVERIPGQPRSIEARLQRLTTAVADRFAADLWRRLRPVLERAEVRAQEAKLGVRQDARELDDDADELDVLTAAARRQIETLIRDMDVAGEVGRIAEHLDRWNAEDIGRVLGVSLEEVVADPAALRVFRRRSVDLIRSIPTQHLERVEDLITEAQTSGMRVETLRRRIQEEHGIAKRRAELIARDQTLKANAALNQQRQTAAGVERYEWDTSQDERVRPEHRRLHGRTFRWDEPPVTNRKGDRNNPGEDFQCRCAAIPIIPD